MSNENKYDVFLSYNSLDHLHVERIANALRERGCSPFVDRWYLTPGKDWVVALEQALQASRSVAIFLGDREMGRWQQRERAWALDQLAGRNDFPVIPVLLPGSEPPLGFMKQLMWIDLRIDPTDSAQIDKLAAAIRQENSELNEKPEPRTVLCPYRGLLAFREEDAEFFFGRQKYTDDLFELVRKNSIVAVTGASGSGKSSVVRAGLVPRLRRRDADGVWDIVTMFPHENPLHSLADALLPLVEPELAGLDLIKKRKSLADDLEHSRVPLWDLVAESLRRQHGTDRLLLVVDQWEELYTTCTSGTQRDRFIQELLDATSRTSSPLSVVFTVRWDFYGEILKNRPLLDRLQHSRLDLGPMNRAELRSVIEEPGKKVGLSFQDGLVERILDDAGEEPGKLPLLEFVLEELWKYRTGDGQLTHAAYDKLGRLTGAIATRADAVFRELTAEEQSAAGFLFRRLVKAGAKTEEDTRRRADLSALDPTTQRVAKKLADERLLVTTRVELAADPTSSATASATETMQPTNLTVEVAHEELLRSWDRLKKWVDADRQFLQWRSRLIPLLGEFDRDPKSALLKGLALRESRKFVPARVAELEAHERKFVESSQKAGQRRTIFAGVLAATFLIGGLFVAQRIHQSNRQRQAQSYVESLLNPAAGAVKPFLNLLAPFRDLAVQELRTAISDEKRDRIQKLHAAYGLIRFGEDRQKATELLLDSIPWIPKDEGTNLVEALKVTHAVKPLNEELERRFNQTTLESIQNRLLAVQLGLGITDKATSICELKADPATRTSFIRGFKEFSGDLNEISKILASTKDFELRSALCTAIGTLGNDAANSTQVTLKKLVVEASDGGTHSAADWALRQQGLTEEELLALVKTPDAVSEELRGKREWYVNHVNMTMLKVPERQFAMGPVDDDKSPSPEDKPEEFNAFWMSDREISVEQFYAVCQKAQRPKDMADGSLPMTSVNWFDAIEFCNELSKQSEPKLKEAYDYDPAGIVRNIDGTISSMGVINETGSDGYCLPTEREWEYACRAMSVTDYTYGKEVNWLGEFVVFNHSSVKSRGSKPPNGWGLFDMHGNAAEWCWDKNKQEFRAGRGGAFDDLRPQWLQSAYRYWLTPDLRLNRYGFRVCRARISF